MIILCLMWRIMAGLIMSHVLIEHLEHPSFEHTTELTRIISMGYTIEDIMEQVKIHVDPLHLPYFANYNSSQVRLQHSDQRHLRV